MFEKLEIVRMAQAMAAHAGNRMGVIARNIAQADTPGYKAMDLPDFAETYRQDSGQGLHVTRPGHIASSRSRAEASPQFAPGQADPNGNTVSLEHEMVNAAEVKQSHEMALAIYRNTSDILRASLGRAR